MGSLNTVSQKARRPEEGEEEEEEEEDDSPQPPSTFRLWSLKQKHGR